MSHPLIDPPLEDKNEKILDQFVKQDVVTKIPPQFDFTPDPIKSGLEGILEGDIQMPFGKDILILQSAAIKAGPAEYDKFLKRHLNRGCKKKWEPREIKFN
jgi:hypothetical protein